MWWRVVARLQSPDLPDARPDRICISKSASAARRRIRRSSCSPRIRPHRPPRAPSSSALPLKSRVLQGFGRAIARHAPLMMAKFIQLLREVLETLWRVPTRLFGSRNERLLKQYASTVSRINALEPQMAALSDGALAGKTDQLKKRYAGGATVEELLPEAFAVVREASKRSLRMRHFDVQLLGGMVLHNGKIAEMKTGEGKTLVATLPAFLNALTGRGVHIVTVNDYLAQRDADWMGRIYRFLGLTVGVNLSQMNHPDKQLAYAADITYGTNNESGFDYLRDNMVFQASERVQRGLHYAIVDEVDSILIDEARTPLTISGPSDEATDKYYKADAIIPQLKKGEEQDGIKTGDYIVDEKAHTAVLTEEGVDKTER